MKENFDYSLKITLGWEGGFVDHPEDPGGATNKGVTQRTYDAYRRRKGLPFRSVRKLGGDELHDIYKTQYWDAVCGDDLPAGIDLAVFDYAVNSGPAQAARDLQRAVGVAVDGIVGDRTLAAAEAVKEAEDVIEAVCDRRLAMYKTLSTWRVFGRGWTRRIVGDRPGVQEGDLGILDYACFLASDLRSFSAPTKSEPAKADPADISIAKTPEGVGGGLIGIGAVGEGLRSIAEWFVPFLPISDAFKWAFIALMLLGAATAAYSLVKRHMEGQPA